MSTPRTAGKAGLDPSGGDADEQGLWHGWRTTRDESTRERLLALHLPYARVIAALVYRQRTCRDIEFEDCQQWARIGLLEALERYDPDAGAQFRTFAAHRIRGEVLDGIAHLTERQQYLHARHRLLAERTKSLSTPAPCAGDAPPVPLREDDTTARRSSDLLDYLAEVGLGLALGFMLEDSGMFVGEVERFSEPDPVYRAVELRHTRHQVRTLVDQLPVAERRVVALHYFHGHAFDDIARQLGLTKGRISQIHKKALGRLRKLMADRRDCDLAF